MTLDQETIKKIREVAEIMNITNNQSSDMNSAGSLPTDIPEWFDQKNNSIDEVAYCTWFRQKHPIKHVGELFYDIDGTVNKEVLTKEIIDDIKLYVKTGLVRRAEQILDTLSYESYCESLPRHTDRIHFKNGTFFLDRRFTPEKEFCSNRLPIDFNPQAPKPEEWLGFLSQLLHAEDIPTLQEFMGYMLIPETRAQVMLMLIGNGGEGKSRVGFVCRHLLGDNMNISSLNKLASNRFAPADQEGKLLMIDDDMKMEALPDTGIIKSIVTMEDKMDLERKGKQSYQGYLYVRLMAFGNGPLSSLYDKSDGFYRRQIIIKVKDRPTDRIDDRNLSDKFTKEIEGIALWCLEGLRRLVANGFNFTISERTRKNQEEIRRDEDSILDFLESDGYIEFDPEAECTTKDLYDAYYSWCQDNLIKPRSETSFSKAIRERASRLGITYVKNITLSDRSKGTRMARGYKGVRALHTFSDNPFRPH